jgi:hypothetical protein
LAKLSEHENFDQLLLDAIDEGLSGLGEAGKASIYIHLEGIFNIRKQEIPNKLDCFSNALQRIFGLGARQLEILIMKNLYAKLGSLCKLDDPSWLTQDVTFTKYVERMKLCYKDTETEKIGKIEVLIDAGEKQEQET